MADLSEEGLYTRWRNRWSNFLAPLERAETPDRVDELLRDKVIIGNAERKIAGGHEGREILELLQNARDAIWGGEREQGRVHIGVYDEGVLVANTGSRFDLFDSAVEDAVTMIGETGKGGDEDQSIGHKGVGLKSILSTGDSFEIFTRPEAKSDDILGVRLSRRYLVAALLDRLGQNGDSSGFTEEFSDQDLADVLARDSRDGSVELTPDVVESISKLPLFNFPVPLDMDAGASEPVRRRVQELLTERPAGSEGDPFRTAVFIRYEDAAWRSLLKEIEGVVPGEQDADARPVEDRPQRIWEYLSATASDGGLEPETLVQLGGIEELHLERSTGPTGDAVQEERWTISREQSQNVATDGLAHEDVRVQIQTGDSVADEHQFDQFSFEDPRDHHTALLVNRAAQESEPSYAAYPLYLFYPIESTNDARLPFCLHGHFRVETNRKDLSSNNFATNRSVLEEGIDLIELVGQEAARAATTPDAPRYARTLPWVLLPPVPPSTDLSEPSSADELIEWFQQTLLTRLADTACIPTVEGPRKPRESLLHWDSTVLKGYLAYTTILDATERDQAVAGSPLPDTRSLDAALTLPPEWTARVKRVLDAEDERAVSRDVLTGWIEHLDGSLSMADGDSPALEVPAGPARSLLTGTIALLTAATDDDDSLSDTLVELSEQFNGVYLLPCRIRDVDVEERLALVTLERRRTPTGGELTQRRVRSVIWDIESASRDVARPPTPPKSANMTVYFLDEEIQQRSDVHHVLSVAGRVWGLRAYEGIPSFVRSLLDTFADGRHDTVSPTDFAFLAAIVDRLGEESTDLQTDEGDFFPLDYLRTAVTQQEGDQRANLRRRVQLRSCELQLHGEPANPIAETVLGDGWQRIRSERQQSSEDEESTEEWQPVEPEASPGVTWPEPKASTWETFREQIKRNVTDFDFVRTLSLLGVASFPRIRTIWLYGDEHPSMRQTHHWNPLEWTQDDFSAGMPDSVQRLQAALRDAPDYVALLTSANNHPQNSADHSSKCPVKLGDGLEQANLASWVWIDDIEGLADHGAAVRELLRRHGDSLDSTLLRTGWSCNRGHKRRAWTDSVPSLVNWQLRELDIWAPVVDVNDELAAEWEAQASRLRYAVRMESHRGAQAARMFPYIEDESGFSDRLLATFGVAPVDELGVTGATERFQKLLSVLVDGSLPDEGSAQLWIPGERINDWNQAYTQLLRPVLKQLPEDPAEMDGIPDLGALTHLPLRDGDEWVVASIDWITANAEKIRYFQDQSPKPWETQAVEDEGLYILPRPAGGPFRRLTAALGVEQLEASKLVFDMDSDNVSLVTDHYSDDVAAFKESLVERRDTLVASTERTDEEEIVATAETLSTATANLAVASSFPDDALRQLSDPASALYATDDGDEALLFNASEMDDDLQLDGLAMGLALLVERPTKVATFREALRDDIAVTDLERRWAKRTFPIETVKRVLGSNRMQALERDIAALNDLLDRLGCPVTDPEPALDALEDADSNTLTEIREWLATGTQPTTNSNNQAEIGLESVVEELVKELRAALPSEAEFVAAGLFGETVTHWVRELERQELSRDAEVTVIEWLDDHRASLERPPFDRTANQAYNRFLTVTELWEQTDVTELTEVDAWSDRLRELHSNTLPAWTASLPAEYAAPLDCPPLVVHVCINNRVTVLVEAFCEEIESELSDIGFDWQGIIESYVADGSIPERESEAGAKDHQQRAFADLATVLGSGTESDVDFAAELTPSQGESKSVESSLSVSTGGGSAGGSTQFRGRGQQAEAYVMAGILDRMATWLDDVSGGDFMQLRSRFRRLHAQQQNADYKWHVDSVWSSDLLPLLEDPGEMDSSSVTKWRSHIADGTPFSKHPLIQLINVTMERGPGYDVIDPRGPLSKSSGRDDFGLHFTPVEIKAVGGATPPFTFRLTTNEYRQAKAFIRDGDTPYVIRLVSVPDPGTVDWPTHTEVVAEKVMETESELEQAVGSHQFEDVVKGGYMNMRIQ